MSLFITRQEFLKLEKSVLGRLSDLKTVTGGKYLKLKLQVLGLNEGAIIGLPLELIGSEAVGACFERVIGATKIGYEGTDLRLGI